MKYVFQILFGLSAIRNVLSSPLSNIASSDFAEGIEQITQSNASVLQPGLSEGQQAALQEQHAALEVQLEIKGTFDFELLKELNASVKAILPKWYLEPGDPVFDLFDDAEAGLITAYGFSRPHDAENKTLISNNTVITNVTAVFTINGRNSSGDAITLGVMTFNSWKNEDESWNFYSRKLKSPFFIMTAYGPDEPALQGVLPWVDITSPIPKHYHGVPASGAFKIIHLDYPNILNFGEALALARSMYDRPELRFWHMQVDINHNTGTPFYRIITPDNENTHIFTVAGWKPL